MNRTSWHLVGRVLMPWAAFVVLCPGCRTGADPQAGFVAGPNSPIPVGSHPVTVIIADFTGDGRPDIALTCGTRADPKTHMPTPTTEK